MLAAARSRSLESPVTGGGTVARCSACGAENRDTFGHCGQCGAPLGALQRRWPERSETPPRQERKVVTSLFCDLVGFTAACEQADPEDVDRVLRVYNQMARDIVETHGGIVEKYIGDAVVAVFGVPAAHEDDAERAVRAGLRLVGEAAGLPGLEDGPLRVRVGVNTGEALVSLDVDPASGEGFLTGDAVNTAARLQSIAPRWAWSWARRRAGSRATSWSTRTWSLSA